LIMLLLLIASRFQSKIKSTIMSKKRTILFPLNQREAEMMILNRTCQCCLILGLVSFTAYGQSTNGSAYLIDLPTALRLAGAQNLDVQIARERLREADANRSSALEQFFPWLAPGVQYHRRDGLAQAVPAGTISSADFQSYSPGGTFAAQLVLGDAIYAALASKQLLRAADQAWQAQREDATLNAASGYFDLAKELALAESVGEAVRTSRDYQQQLHQAVAAGIAFKGDELRVQTQTERYQTGQRQARERQRVAAANLAQVLHLDASIELQPRDAGLNPVLLIQTNTPLDSLVQQAIQSRPELKEAAALASASRANRNAAVYGPLIPALGAQAFLGGLGGGPDHGPSTFGAAEDYLVSLNWRIGPGGLFDVGRVQAAKARLAVAELNNAKLKDAVVFQVVSNLTRVQSLSDQIELARRSLTSASETLRLTRERKQFGVGAVLEDIQAQQELTQARSDYITALAEFNKAQYGLSKAVGGTAGAVKPEPTAPK
jgi:outer membrane protein TolC